MAQSAYMREFPQSTDDCTWISTYVESRLSRKKPGTINVYQRVLSDFLLWLDSQSMCHFPQIMRHLTLRNSHHSIGRGWQQSEPSDACQVCLEQFFVNSPSMNKDSSSTMPHEGWNFLHNKRCNHVSSQTSNAQFSGTWLSSQKTFRMKRFSHLATGRDTG
jgi:hypothetical protein